VYNIIVRYSIDVIRQIRAYRSRGLTYGEINLRLETPIPKSSLSYICRNVSISKQGSKLRSERLRSRTLANQRRAVISNKRLFEEKLLQLKLKNEAIGEYAQQLNSKKMLLAILYLAEGSKWKSRRGPQLGSSDPRMLKLYIKLLNDCFEIDKSQLKARIQHRADQNPKSLIAFWSLSLGLPKDSFYPCYIDKRTIGKKTKKQNYYGVCSITCSGTQIQLELQQITDIIYESLGC
jgi:hypothetical protein